MLPFDVRVTTCGKTWGVCFPTYFIYHCSVMDDHRCCHSCRNLLLPHSAPARVEQLRRNFVFFQVLTARHMSSSIYTMLLESIATSWCPWRVTSPGVSCKNHFLRAPFKAPTPTCNSHVEMTLFTIHTSIKSMQCSMAWCIPLSTGLLGFMRLFPSNFLCNINA